MMKKRTFEAAYDEASSSSESDDESSSEDEEEEVTRHGKSDLDNDEGSNEDDSSNNNDDDDDDDDSNESQSNDDEQESATSEEISDDEDGDGADLPLEERVRRQEARGVSLQSTRERKRTALEAASQRLAQSKKSKTTAETTQDSPAKKKSKHAPTEVSSKRADFYRRGFRLNESGLGVEIGANRYKPLDPRTSSLSGHLNEEQFEKNYEFLQEMRNKEISTLKKQIAARKVTGKKGKRMRRQLNVSLADESLEEAEQRFKQLKQEKADFERRKITRAAKQAVKKKIQTEVELGNRGAYFLKRKEKKKLEFEARMEELRKRGGHKAVEKALAKKRQKAKSRDASLFVK